MTFEPGQRWRLTRDHGNPPLHLQAGTVGTVREFVDAGTPGAHNDDEDAVVLEFAHREAVFGDDGEPVAVTNPRAAAFPVEDFDGADPLFEVAD